jgi:mannose-6-phosphate isomerase-like protein (cupin superfamily)
VHDRARQLFSVLSGRAQLRPAGVAHQFVGVGDTDVRFRVISAPTTRGDRRAAEEATDRPSSNAELAWAARPRR